MPPEDYYDYWYVYQNELEPDQVFLMYDGSYVRLDHRVPGDGTQWYVANWFDGWAFYDDQIEPGNLRGEPLSLSEFDSLINKKG